jgi:hypothetical protein
MAKTITIMEQCDCPGQSLHKPEGHYHAFAVLELIQRGKKPQIRIQLGDSEVDPEVDNWVERELVLGGPDAIWAAAVLSALWTGREAWWEVENRMWEEWGEIIGW